MKKAARWVAFVLLIALVGVSVQGATSNEKLTTTQKGQVMEVIDGDALYVRLFNGGGCYVRLIGVNAQADEDALKFMTNYAMGKQVTLVPDVSRPMQGRFNMAYVYMDMDNGTLLNQLLLEKGYGKLDLDFQNTVMYNNLNDAQLEAKSRGIGLWSDKSSISSGGYRYTYTGDMVNINTASKTQLVEYLEGVNNSIATEIINYRKDNPFNTIQEIKFVEGFTYDLFEENKDNMTVTTNINIATQKELATLDNLTSSDVSNLIKFRGKNGFGKLSEFYSETGINQNKYDSNRDFIIIDEDDEHILTVAKPSRTVNINTATVSQIKAIDGVTETMANRIVQHRDDYGFKTYGELVHISGLSITRTNMHALEDNLHVMTDINHATDAELRSLLGNKSTDSLITEIKLYQPYSNITEIRRVVGNTLYDQIKDYIYVDKNEGHSDRVNINTATEAQLLSVGFTSTGAQKILAKQGSMIDGTDIPADISSIKEKVALYTDVNTASTKELQSLHPRMSDKMVNEIIYYRAQQPFGDVDEVKDLFSKNNEIAIFNSFKDFIVVR